MTMELPVDNSAKPLLTIAIPTYNRARYLEELLSSLFDQLIAEPRVELIVSDNASPDETPELVEEFRKRGLQLRYIRNETNIGSDANFLQCFEQALGKYVWLFGDDDILDPGALNKIVDIISRDDYDLVYVLHYPFKNVGEEHHPKRLPPPEIIRDANVFVRKMYHSLTFISGNIVNKQRIVSFRHLPFDSLVGTNLVQLGWVYSALNHFERGVYISEQLVGARDSNFRGLRSVIVFGPTLKTITEMRLDSSSLRREIINNVLETLLPFYILNFRREQECEESLSSRLTPSFHQNSTYWIYDYPLLVSPRWIAECYYLFLRILNKAKRCLARLRASQSEPPQVATSPREGGA